MIKPAPARLLLVCALALGLVPPLPADSAKARLFSAVRDFQPVKAGAFVRYYIETKSPDPAEHGVAIQTPRYHDRPAAADLIYSGPAGIFDSSEAEPQTLETESMR